MTADGVDDVRIRRLEAGDPPVVSGAFAAIAWKKPVEQYQRYLDEQRSGRRDVFVAFSGGTFAGYVTVNWQPDYPPLSLAGTPEIQDLNVLPAWRRRGIASRLLDEAEGLAARQSDRVGIGVGLHPGYNVAQRLYVLRGYVPDGHGVTAGNMFVREGQTIVLDDDVVLHLIKRLRLATA
jgi:GNAT superfamily N-acetyltransferase